MAYGLKINDPRGRSVNLDLSKKYKLFETLPIPVPPGNDWYTTTLYFTAQTKTPDYMLIFDGDNSGGVLGRTLDSVSINSNSITFRYGIMPFFRGSTHILLFNHT